VLKAAVDARFGRCTGRAAPEIVTFVEALRPAERLLLEPNGHGARHTDRAVSLTIRLAARMLGVKTVGLPP